MGKDTFGLLRLLQKGKELLLIFPPFPWIIIYAGNDGPVGRYEIVLVWFDYLRYKLNMQLKSKNNNK